MTSDLTMHLPDAIQRPPDRRSEDYRHWCEVRTVVRITYPELTARNVYITNVAKQRGAAAADQLQKDVTTLWDAVRRSDRSLPAKSGIASELQDFLGI